MMFRVNDVIIYGSQGVCEITAIEEKSISGAKRSYFVLRPINDRGATIYAPTDNALVLQKMRRLLTVDEIHGLIDTMPGAETVWIDQVNDRREHYKKILASGDHAALIQMIRAIYAHKKEREATGKRLHMMDENFFKDAEQILYNEFQYVLRLPGKDALLAYILERIEGGANAVSTGG